MSDPADYHARWKKNAAIAGAIATALPDARDWEIVFRFYGAVHLVEGTMRAKGERFYSERHEQRLQKIKMSPEAKPAEASYRELQDLSENVRYDPAFVPRPEDFANAERCAAKIESVFKNKLERALQSAVPSAAPSTPPVPPDAPAPPSAPSKA